MKMSICTYQDGSFEVMIKNDEGEEVMLCGEQKLTPEEFEIVDKIAPACVWTKYERSKSGR